ncbi:MAG TPA: triose-phosphate isomerase [Candidatus Nanoarchaeia archaeon]|nr:triose-phosphate isomerase [Candidatus Nanoarchaeia archaeon]
MKPLILINFKTYSESAGIKALKLAQEIAKVKSKKYQIGIAPSLLSIKEVAKKVKIQVFSQHADPVFLGAHTGSVSVEELKKIKVIGTILNHSERKLKFRYLKEIVKDCKKEKLKTIVCASSIWEVKKVAQLQPDYLAYEPRKLIGGKISVTEAKPKIIIRAVEAVKYLSPKTKLLCGAGIHSRQDLGQALLSGAEGVLIAHAVVKARNPKKFLEGLLD